ncbi:DUF2567 domain-containing protein [Nakamurella sp. A5-74]|uniref:DUF2567 domain-containing protein n=1 Tax=Nakamurella sp. A5-74 TaxID=3158264 RepID=A0AAU8DU75_9ACTN
MQRRLAIAHLGVAAVAAIAMLGASALWIVLTPQQQWIVYPQTPDLPQGQALSLPLESYFRFTSIAFFTLGALVVGAVTAVAAWQIRFARGVPMVLVLIGSLAAGSALGLLVGHLVRGGVDPAVVAANGVTTPTLVEMPASISRWAVVIAPGVAAVVYVLTAAWHSDPDLGRPRLHSTQDLGSTVPSDRAAHCDPSAPDDRTVPFDGSVPSDRSGDPITAPIPVVVGAGALTHGRHSPEAGSAQGFHPDRPPTRDFGVAPGPSVGPGPTIGAGPSVGPGPSVTPGDGRQRTDPSPGTR